MLRDYFRPIIAEVLEANAGKSEREIRQSLRAAFPSGERKYWPYKVWLDEVRVQLKKKRPKQKEAGVPQPRESLPGQMELF